MNCRLWVADCGLVVPALRARAPRAVQAALRNRQSAFSLTEVMFAVIVLGIGFILVAAIFPVSISQSRLTVDETTAAANARSALGLTSVIAENGDARQIAGVNAPLLPTTDLYTTPPAAAGSVSTAVVQVPGGQQARIGKVLSFNDARLDAA